MKEGCQGACEQVALAAAPGHQVKLVWEGDVEHDDGDGDHHEGDGNNWNWLPTYVDFRQLHTQRCPSHQWWRPSGPDDGDDGADDNDGGGGDVVDVEEEEKEEQDKIHVHDGDNTKEDGEHFNLVHDGHMA